MHAFDALAVEHASRLFTEPGKTLSMGSVVDGRNQAGGLPLPTRFCFWVRTKGPSSNEQRPTKDSFTRIFRLSHIIFRRGGDT